MSRHELFISCKEIKEMSLPQGLEFSIVEEVPRYFKNQQQIAYYRYQQEYLRRNSDHMTENIPKAFWEEVVNKPFVGPLRRDFQDRNAFDSARRLYLLKVLHKQLRADVRRRTDRRSIELPP